MVGIIRGGGVDGGLEESFFLLEGFADKFGGGNRREKREGVRRTEGDQGGSRNPQQEPISGGWGKLISS